MFTLTKRLCTLAAKAKADSKTDDGAELTYLTFELENIALDANELNAILQEPHAHQVLYNSGKDPIEPYLKSLKALEIKDAMSGAYVAIAFSLDEADTSRFAYADAKITKVKLTLSLAGETLMSCRVVATATEFASLPDLIERLGHTVAVEIRAEAPGAQQDLPLNNFKGDSDPTVSGLGRQIQANAAKEERKRKQKAKQTSPFN